MPHKLHEIYEADPYAFGFDAALVKTQILPKPAIMMTMKEGPDKEARLTPEQQKAEMRNWGKKATV